MVNKKILIFIHIPKTAGTALKTIIKRQFPRDSVVNIYGHKPNSIDVATFKNMEKKEKEKIKCLIGHFQFGLHQYLPQPATYITMFRNPVDRIISSYYYIIRSPSHCLYKKIIGSKMSLKDFVSSDTTMRLLNLQTKFIGKIGNERHTVNDKFVSGDILEIAKNNIVKNNIIFGVTEKFDESVSLFKQLLGWQNIFYVKKNVTDKRLATKAISKRVRRIIEEKNELDLELYEFVRKRFEEAIDKQGKAFRRKVYSFQIQNKIWGWKIRTKKCFNKSAKA